MDDMLYSRAAQAKAELVKLTSQKKNLILRKMAKALLENEEEIVRVNQIDIIEGEKNGLSEALLDRLTLNHERIMGMAASLEVIADFKDPIGEVVEGFKTDTGLLIERVRTPLGVVGIIYESRPNVTVDAAALCLKASNVVILRGSSAAINSNEFLAELFARVGRENGLPENSINIIKSTDRAKLDEFVKQDKYVDVLIPRGGKALKNYIQEKATIPIILTGAGTCHAYIDEGANLEMATNIIINAKTQRPSTCNSLECILINESLLSDYSFKLVKELLDNQVKVNLTKEVFESLDDKLKNRVNLVGSEEFGEEYLSLEILITSVRNVDRAIEFINTYSTNHSEVIVTQNVSSSEKFLNEVDSACVYLNASTRFSDGGEFGFGGEIGISTQKLHARGPMGISALTSEKFIIRGRGEVRG